MPCCSQHGVMPSLCWEPTSSSHSRRISYLVPVVCGTLDHVCLPYSPGDLVIRTRSMWWRWDQTNRIVVAGVRSAGWRRARTCSIVTARSARVLAHTGWGPAISVKRRVPTLVTPSATTVLILLTVSLLAWLHVVCSRRSVTLTCEFRGTGPDEGLYVPHLFTTRSSVVVSKIEPAKRRRVCQNRIHPTRRLRRLLS